MHTAYLLLGSNTGNRPDILARAREALERNGCAILAVSGIWETAPWGNIEQEAFLNQAVAVGTPLPAMDLLHLLLEIEAGEGRVRTEKWAPRTLDMDILFFDDAVIDVPGLHVPHPHLQDRRFALAPLAEIAPKYVHPLLGRCVTELLDACPDHSEVTLIPQARS